MATERCPLARQMEIVMERKPLSTDFLRPDGQVVPSTVVLYEVLIKTLGEAGVKIANVSEDFVAYYHTYWEAGSKRSGAALQVGTVRKPMPHEWVAAFHYWAGINLRTLFGAITLQGKGGEGMLLTNGKLNGCILAEDPQYAATFRWHDPTRPYPEQTATFPDLGWSLHVVHVNSRCWCPQGGRVLYV